MSITQSGAIALQKFTYPVKKNQYAIRSSLLLSVNKKRHRARHYHKHHSKTSLQSQKTYNPSFLIKKVKVFSGICRKQNFGHRSGREKPKTLQAFGVPFCGATPVASTLFVLVPLFAFLPPCWWCRSLELSVSESGHLNYDQKCWRAGYKGRFSFNFRLEIQGYSGHS